jgi:hypothetical protein
MNFISTSESEYFDTSPEGPELEGKQVEIKSKAAKIKELIRNKCPIGF